LPVDVSSIGSVGGAERDA
jgi:hypothetical protein